MSFCYCFAKCSFYCICTKQQRVLFFCFVWFDRRAFHSSQGLEPIATWEVKIPQIPSIIPLFPMDMTHHHPKAANHYTEICHSNISWILFAQKPKSGMTKDKSFGLAARLCCGKHDPLLMMLMLLAARIQCFARLAFMFSCNCRCSLVCLLVVYFFFSFSVRYIFVVCSQRRVLPQMNNEKEISIFNNNIELCVIW